MGGKQPGGSFSVKCTHCAFCNGRKSVGECVLCTKYTCWKIYKKNYNQKTTLSCSRDRILRWGGETLMCSEVPDSLTLSTHVDIEHVLYSRQTI